MLRQRRPLIRGCVLLGGWGLLISGPRHHANTTSLFVPLHPWLPRVRRCLTFARDTGLPVNESYPEKLDSLNRACLFPYLAEISAFARLRPISWHTAELIIWRTSTAASWNGGWYPAWSG